MSFAVVYPVSKLSDPSLNGASHGVHQGMNLALQGHCMWSVLVVWFNLLLVERENKVAEVDGRRRRRISCRKAVDFD